MEQSELVSQFVAVTGASAETGTFFLESAGNDLSAAIDSYYASGGNAAGAMGGGVAAGGEEEPSAPAPIPSASLQGPTGAQGQGRGPAAAPKPAPRRAAAGNVRSLADLAAGVEESEDDDHNEYYAGGEKSGQVVRGAPKKEDAGPGRVEQLFDAARRSGAVEGSAADLQGPGGGGGGASGASAFRGTAHTLAGGVVGLPPATAQAAAAPGAGAPAAAPRAHTITFYRNGIFTVDDGEPRSVEDPANLPFLRSIERGECPAELEPGTRDSPVTVNLMRRDEEYTAPEKPRYTAFGGSGRKLTDEPAAEAPPASAAASSSGAAAAAVPVTGQWEGVDESAPTTSLQLRLADGTRMVARFNLTHTVGDIRRFIRASRPDIGEGYQLMTAFPSQQLADDGATIDAAGLANAVLIQKM